MARNPKSYDDIIATLPKAAEQNDNLSPNPQLIKAAENGHLDTVKYLHEHGADITAEYNGAIRWAAENGHLDTVKYLHQHGADITADNNYAIRWAANNGHLDTVKYLHKHGADITAENNYAIRWAATNGHLDTVKYLHEHGADITADNNYAIQWAANNGHLDIVKYLHEHGADITAENNFAIRWAANNGHLDTVKYLHKHGADITAENNYAIQWAAANGHLDTVKYLHKHGADITAANNYAIQWAANNGHLDIVKYLHEHGADITAANNYAIQSAAANGHMDTVKYLHKHGADITAANNYAIRWAAANGHLDTVKYLHKHGADITAENNYAIRRAAVNGHMDIVKYLHEHGAPLSPDVKEKLRNHERWLSRHGRCPQGLINLSPFLFRPQAFDDVLTMLEKEGYEGKTAHKYAYHAAGLFRTTDRVLTYLQKWGVAGKQPLHDVIQSIALPQEGRFNIAAWGDAVLRHGPKMAKLVKFAAKIPEPAKDPKGQWSYRNTFVQAAKNNYRRGTEHPELAAYCLQAAYDEDEFDESLDLVLEYQNQFAANDNLKPQNRVPAITIDGTEFGKSDYIFRKLPDGDIRGLILGEFTNCCQHVGGEGSECAVHGFLSPEGGFYAISHKKTGDIIAQSWAWRGKKDELVLDSLESLPGHITTEQWVSLCNHFAAAACEDKPAKISAVCIGKDGATPKLPFPDAAADKIAKPIDYKGDRDSDEQYIITPPR